MPPLYVIKLWLLAFFLVWAVGAVIGFIVSLFTVWAADEIVTHAVDAYGPINNNNGFGIEPRLVGRLWYLGTDDNSLLGDAGFKEEWAGKPRIEQMTAWLQRNPAYVFEREILGAVIRPGSFIWSLGNASIKNRTQGVAGLYLCGIGWWYWNIKMVLRLGFTWRGHTIGRPDRCWMPELGWKLQPYIQHGLPQQIEKAQIVCSPFRFTEFYPL